MWSVPTEMPFGGNTGASSFGSCAQRFLFSASVKRQKLILQRFQTKPCKNAIHHAQVTPMHTNTHTRQLPRREKRPRCSTSSSQSQTLMPPVLPKGERYKTTSSLPRGGRYFDPRGLHSSSPRAAHGTHRGREASGHAPEVQAGPAEITAARA